MDDLRSLVADALRRLVEETRARRAVAWVNDPDAGALVLASAGDAAPSAPAPEPAELSALEPLERATALREDETRRALAERHHLDAAVPLAPGAAEEGWLLLGGVSDASGAVRPRALAALESAARRLRGPFGAARAGARLARIDAEVRRLDRLAGLGSLVSEVLHEVRNPLVSIKTFLHLLPDHIDEDEFRRSFFEVVSSEMERLEKLLDVVLDYASPDRTASPIASTPTPQLSGSCDPGEVAASVERLLSYRAAVAGVRLESELPRKLPPAPLAAAALRQVLLNLVVNALDVTAAGGDVRVTARAIGPALELSVDDRGPGVPPALRRRVFEPFFTTRGDRAGGLGLAISRRIVDEAGGILAVVDRPGGGSRFRIRLPFAASTTR
ncbi:MAG: HAMP domain-containing sensor histidine kinase [Myxococcota bacterium]|nr:HAMP domain-containing sensor histidine kinase [Myxococcota bacterium]